MQQKKTRGPNGAQLLVYEFGNRFFNLFYAWSRKGCLYQEGFTLDYKDTSEANKLYLLMLIYHTPNFSGAHTIMYAAKKCFRERAIVAPIRQKISRAAITLDKATTT